MRCRGSWSGAALIAAAFFGCVDNPPDLTLVSIEPGTIRQDVPTTATLTGTGFYANVSVDLDDDSPVTVSRDWEATVVGAAIRELVRESPSTLRGNFPVGLPLGRHDVILTAPDGDTATLVGGVLVVAEGEETQLSIEDAPGGRGNAVETMTLSTDDSLELHAVERDPTGVFVADQVVTWSLEDGLGTLPTGPASQTTFSPNTPGRTRIRATLPSGGFAATELITVVPGQAATITVFPETLTAALGDPATQFTVVGQDGDGNDTADVGTLSWSTTGTVGTVDRDGQFSPAVAGQGTVRATSSYGPQDESGAVTVLSNVQLQELARNPFGNGTTFTHVFSYRGKLTLATDWDGRSMVRMDPDGSNPETISLAFFSDNTGNSSRNGSSTPYPSIGHLLCLPGTSDCGPDNEHGRGLVTSVTLSGREWLLFSGGRPLSGDLDYIYMTQGVGTAIDIPYVDLGDALGPQTRVLSAAHAFGNDLYLGFSDSGGARPFFIRLETFPSMPGLDATASDYTDLEGRNFTGFPTSDPAMVDAIWDFGGRLYAANAGAWHRATEARPNPFDANPQTWSEVTPSAPAYASKTSRTTNFTSDLRPALRAVPQAAVFQGTLYVGRNTTDGPQLWRCNPTATASATDCDAGDWELVAANAVGDSELTQFNNSNNRTIGLVAATSTSLYVGFNNEADGMMVFRSRVQPASASDFEGEAGCSAANHPGGCSGIGGGGFGDTDIEEVFDAKALTFGSVEGLFFAAGGGLTTPARLYRITP